MKAKSTIFSILLLTGCGNEVTHPKQATELEASSFTSAWVMTGMEGYMGVAIALSSNQFFYWFYTDVTHDELKYPIIGSYTFDGTNLHLISNTPLYSKEWISTTNSKGWPCLVSPFDVEGESRLLVKHPKFDPKNPFSFKQLLRQNNPNQPTSQSSEVDR